MTSVTVVTITEEMTQRIYKPKTFLTHMLLGTDFPVKTDYEPSSSL